MGRLFWKFFFAFWLALLTAGIGVGSAVWLRHAAQDDQRPNPAETIDVRRASLVTLAASIVPHSGINGLRDFIRTLQNTRFPAIYAVDDANQELLGRPLAAQVLQQARALHAKGAYPNALKMITVENGRRFLLFVPLPEQGFADIFRQPPTINLLPPLDLLTPPPRDNQGLPDVEPGHRPPPRRREPPSPILPIVAGGLASLLFSALLAWYFAKPIRSLRTALNALAQGHLDSRIGHVMGRRRDELADLGRDFDHMAEQIRSLVNAQQHLLHDVSHELRSPLARIQAAIGLAQQQPEKIAATLDRIEHESQRMSDLVGELLMLSRLEAGVATKMDTVDIGELLAEIVDDVGFEAEQHGVTLRYPGLDGTMGRCDSELLHRAIENVLRNAIQHCHPQGHVDMRATVDGPLLRISIEDQGPGVPDSELTAIFQPFFRGGRQQKKLSTGLGLTIAQRAIAAHAGTIAASNRPEGGLRVTIEIPLRGAKRL